MSRVQGQHLRPLHTLIWHGQLLYLLHYCMNRVHWCNSNALERSPRHRQTCSACWGSQSVHRKGQGCDTCSHSRRKAGRPTTYQSDGHTLGCLKNGQSPTTLLRLQYCACQGKSLHGNLCRRTKHPRHPIPDRFRNLPTYLSSAAGYHRLQKTLMDAGSLDQESYVFRVPRCSRVAMPCPWQSA